MDIAALVVWVLTALGGFVMLGRWIAAGGLRGQGASRLPAPVVFGHFALAAAGLVLWIAYLLLDARPLAWAAFVVLLPVALLGFGLLARWRTSRRPAAVGAATGARAPEAAGAPADDAIPLPVVVGHGVLAVATVVLVLLAALAA